VILIAHRNQSADSIFHVLEDLFRQRTFSEPDHGTTYPVAVNAGGNDHANLAVSIVFNQDRAAVVQPTKANTFRGVVEDFSSEIPFHRQFG